jgi:hypothetical protein
MLSPWAIGGHEFFLLFLGAEGEDGKDAHAVVHGHAKSQGRRYPGEFFDGDDIADGVEVGAPVFFRHLEPEEIQGFHLFHDFPGKARLLVQEGDMGLYFAFGEFPHGFADQLVFHAGIEIHNHSPS